MISVSGSLAVNEREGSASFRWVRFTEGTNLFLYTGAQTYFKNSFVLFPDNSIQSTQNTVSVVV